MNGEAANLNNEGTGNGAAGEIQTPAWKAQLPEDMRGNESLNKFATIGDLAKAHGDLMSEREGSIKVPGENATDEDRNAFLQKMGRPETADGYEVGKPSDWPEGVTYNEDMEKAFKQEAFSIGLPADKASQLFAWYNQMTLDGHNEVTRSEDAAIEKADNELKDLWKGDAYKVNTEIAHRAFKHFGGESAAELLNTVKIGNLTLGEHPVFRKLFHNIGKTISDDTINAGAGMGGELSPEDEAKKRFPNTKF